MTALARREDAGLELPLGEALSIPERVIVAPVTGIFQRHAGDLPIKAGSPIDRGDVVGIIRSLGSSTPVKSPFEGSLVAILAQDGERLRLGQPVAWLRVT